MIFLSPDGDCPSWTCIGNDSSEFPVPRVKLTGTGKMPVADMRAVNNIQVNDQNGQSRYYQYFSILLRSLWLNLGNI